MTVAKGIALFVTPIEALRAKTELALGKKFNVKAYHDFLINEGLLPPDLLEEAVTETFVPERKAAP